MMDFLRRHKKWFLITGIFLCIGAIILTINPTVGPTIATRILSYVVVPMQQGATSAIGWIQGRFVILTSNERILSEMQELREEITRLETENQRLRLADEENVRLNTLMGMTQRYAPLPKLGARLIGQNPNDWQSSFTIDRGTTDGLYNNMAVLGDGGLLGVLRHVGPRYAQVISIIDSRFAAGVVNLRTEDVGVVRGDVQLMQQGLLRMDFIDVAGQIMPGDELVTSAHSAIFPPGIMVGTIISVEPNLDRLTQHAIVQPAVNLDRVDFVLVVAELFGDAYVTYDAIIFDHHED